MEILSLANNNTEVFNQCKFSGNRMWRGGGRGVRRGDGISSQQPAAVCRWKFWIVLKENRRCCKQGGDMRPDTRYAAGGGGKGAQHSSTGANPQTTPLNLLPWYYIVGTLP